MEYTRLCTLMRSLMCWQTSVVFFRQQLVWRLRGPAQCDVSNSISVDKVGATEGDPKGIRTGLSASCQVSCCPSVLPLKMFTMLGVFLRLGFDWSLKLSTCQPCGVEVRHILKFEFRSVNRALMPVHSFACRSCCTPNGPHSLEGSRREQRALLLMFIAVYLCHQPQPTSFPQATLHPSKSSQCRSFSTRVSPCGLEKFSLKLSQ